MRGIRSYYEFDRYHLTHDGVAPDERVGATTNDTLPNHNWTARATWVMSNRTTFEARTNGFAGTYSFDPPPPGTRSGPPGHVDVATGLWYGNASDYWDFRSGRTLTAVSVNHYADGLARGHHDIKAGAEVERSVDDAVHGYPGGRLYLDRSGLPYEMRMQSEYERAATIHRGALYAQDSWAATDHMTVQAGIRATVNRGLVSQGTVLATSPVDPRLGAAWAVGSSHKTVVRTHVGRYHDALLTSHFQALDTSPLPPLITAQVIGPDQSPDGQELGRQPG
jgi:hypothetical protein